ncbi:hypothetical protein ACF9IK_30485 [Kitasatospora hibisci]
MVHPVGQAVLIGQEVAEDVTFRKAFFRGIVTASGTFATLAAVLPFLL